MWTFYEMQNLMDSKLEERSGIKYMPMRPEGDPDQYIDPIRKTDNVSASDKYVGRNVGKNPELADIGAKLPNKSEEELWANFTRMEREGKIPDAASPSIAIMRWKRDNPELASFWDRYHQKSIEDKEQEREERLAAPDSNINYIRSRSGKVKGTTGMDRHNLSDMLNREGTPIASDANIVNKHLLENDKLWGKEKRLGVIYGMFNKLNGWEPSRTLDAIKYLSTKTNLLSIHKSEHMGKPINVIKIHNPFENSETSNPNDTEDEISNRGKFVPEFDPNSGSEFKTHSADQDIEGVNELENAKQKANQILLNKDGIPDPKEIESVKNDLKSVLTAASPEEKIEIKGYLKELERLVPQREWFDIYESMCYNGI